MEEDTNRAAAQEESRPRSETLHVFKIWISAPLDKVFYELTRTDAPQPCFGNHRLTTPGLAPGEPLQWRSHSGRYVSGMGRVLVYEAPCRFGHSFTFSRYDDASFDAHYELCEARGGTAVTLRYMGLPMHTPTAAAAVAGARFALPVLKQVAEADRASTWARLRLRGAAWLEPLRPLRSRVEYWPIEQPSGGAFAAGNEHLLR